MMGRVLKGCHFQFHCYHTCRKYAEVSERLNVDQVDGNREDLVERQVD